MSLVELKRNPSPRDLRLFAPLLALFVTVLGSIVRWRFDAPTLASGIWIAGTLLVVLYLAVPRARRPLFVGWMLLTFPIGWVVSHTVLVVVYFLVLTPIGLMRRAAGQDPLSRKWDARADSYWEKRPAPPTLDRYFRQS